MDMWAKLTFRILFLIAEWTASLSTESEVYSYQVKNLREEFFKELGDGQNDEDIRV